MPRSKRDIPEYRLRRHDNGTWYVHWSEARRTKRATTGTEDKAEAQRFLADFTAARHGPPEDPTVSAILDGYLDDRDGIAVAHKRMVEVAVPLRAFFGHMTPRQVTPAYTRAYGKMRGVMPGTVIKELKTLRAALNWALRREWIDRAPFIELPAAPQPRARWLSRDEFALIRMSGHVSTSGSEVEIHPVIRPVLLDDLVVVFLEVLDHDLSVGTGPGRYTHESGEVLGD